MLSAAARIDVDYFEKKMYGPSTEGERELSPDHSDFSQSSKTDSNVIASRMFQEAIEKTQPKEQESQNPRTKPRALWPTMLLHSVILAYGILIAVLTVTQL